jgi:hypothetical protein
VGVRSGSAVLVAAIGIVTTASRVGAQARAVVAGAVVEPTTGLPVPNVEVRVLGTTTMARSDSLGGFTLLLDAGRYLVRATRLGFGPRSLPIELAAGDTMTLSVEMDVLPVVLSEVVVKAREERYRGKMATFAERMRTSTAPRSSFILRDEIQRRHPPRLSTLINERGGRIQSCASTATVYVDGAMIAPDRITAPKRGRRTAPTDRDPHLDDFVAIDDVEAIEVYAGGADTPAEFLATAPRGMAPGCTVLIWTR